MPEGSVTSESAEQKLNRSSFNAVTPLGIVISVSDEQFQNVFWPILLSVPGRVTDESFVHPVNIYPAIEVMPSGRDTDVRDVQ